MVYAHYEGTGLPATPGAETIWEASVEGTELVTLDFTLPTEGDWAVVVMNADASPGVTADLALGAQVSVTAIALSQVAVGIGALIAGGLAALVAVLRLRGPMIGLGLAIAGVGALGSFMAPPYFMLPVVALGLGMVILGVKRARDAQRSEDHPRAEHPVTPDTPAS